MLDVFHRSWVVSQFRQSVMPEFSMQQILFAFILILRDFFTKLYQIEFFAKLP